MSIAKHTPGPWKTGTAECRSLDAVFGPLDGQHGVTSGVIAQCGAVARPAAENEANARLIASAPELLAELRDTADWLDERAVNLTGLLADGSGWGRGVAGAEKRQEIRNEIARLQGRAVVIRQTILTATGG